MVVQLDKTASADGMESRKGSPEFERKGSIVIVEPRTLMRECLTRCLRSVAAPNEVHSIVDVAALKDLAAEKGAPAVVVLCVPNRERMRAAIESMHAADLQALPVVVLANEEDSMEVLDALDAGAKGFISTSLSIEVAIEALRLVAAGGTYVPASSLLASRSAASQPGTPGNPHGIFTERQFAVVEMLRQGKANKIIAYELNMRESTVKVHIRNIMRKLNATNRTQVAYLYQAMLAESQAAGEPVPSLAPKRNG